MALAALHREPPSFSSVPRAVVSEGHDESAVRRGRTVFGWEWWTIAQRRCSPPQYTWGSTGGSVHGPGAGKPSPQFCKHIMPDFFTLQI